MEFYVTFMFWVYVVGTIGNAGMVLWKNRTINFVYLVTMVGFAIWTGNLLWG